MRVYTKLVIIWSEECQENENCILRSFITVLFAKYNKIDEVTEDATLTEVKRISVATPEGYTRKTKT
jgi:hypothetical protein